MSLLSLDPYQGEGLSQESWTCATFWLGLGVLGPWTVVADKFRSCCNGDNIDLLLGVTSHKPDKSSLRFPSPVKFRANTVVELNRGSGEKDRDIITKEEKRG